MNSLVKDAQKAAERVGLLSDKIVINGQTDPNFWGTQLKLLQNPALARQVVLTLDLPHLKLEPCEGEESAEPTLPERTLSNEEQELCGRIVAALGKHQGNVAQVARELGKAPTQVYRWMQRYKIRPGSFRV